MARGRRHDRKGRSTGNGSFVMLPHFVFDSPGYQSLKPGPRALLFEVIRRFNGSNNGRIGFSQREMAAELNVTDRETIARYARELEARGLIEARRRGGFNVKVADRRSTEWALTWLPVGEELATKAFLRWRPEPDDGAEKSASKDGIPVQDLGRVVHLRPSVPEKPTRQATVLPQSRAEKPSTYTSKAIGDARKEG